MRAVGEPPAVTSPKRADASANETRQLLSDRARQVRRDLGGLGRTTTTAPVTVTIGDHISCRRDDALADVDNGTCGNVLATGDDGLTIYTDSGAERDLPARYVAERVEPASALTGHGMQGGTVGWAAVVGEPWDLTRGWSHTDASRARSTTKLHVVAAHEAEDPTATSSSRTAGRPVRRGPRPSTRRASDGDPRRRRPRDRPARRRGAPPERRPRTPRRDRGSPRRASRASPASARDPRRPRRPLRAPDRGYGLCRRPAGRR